MDFSTLPREAFTLSNVTVLAPDGTLQQGAKLSVNGDTIAQASGGPALDMGGRMVLPAFVDMHTHLDKGHIWGRSPNPDGTFMGALSTVSEDRAARWSAEDVRTRMAFALRCAYAHGTRAIRTHLDSIPPQAEISFPVFRELRADWAGKIDLQAACLVGIDHVNKDTYAATAQLVADSGGVLGAVAYPVPDLAAKLDIIFKLADQHGLDVDFHADETEDPASACLRAIAEAKLRHRFEGKVVVGHCCSLAQQAEAEADETMDVVAKADLNIVSLPLCNLYLQDRHSPHTPRWRGVTLVHEMAARGINVSFASDNTRDPFYAYGDLDMIEVMREATRIAHLDHVSHPWATAFAANPARACGFATPSLAPGAPADFILVNARTLNELYARPQADRIVVRAGQQIDRTLPAYAELDPLMEAHP
ncbi:MAG: cytosine deaminase [Pseudomonadota bacterium]